RVEIFFDIEIYYPTQSVAHEARMQRLQGLMSRATRPEAVRAGKEILLVDGLQHHDNRPLRHLVLEGWHGRIKLHFDPDSLWDRLKSHTRFIRSVVRRLLS